MIMLLVSLVEDMSGKSCIFNFVVMLKFGCVWLIVCFFISVSDVLW